jgi:DNA-binding transcriptional MerR regulator
MKTDIFLEMGREDWSLDDLADEANQRLEEILPEQSGKSRTRDSLNPRLIRHYTTQGLVDRPFRSGREARYGRKHLLQLLVIRRLLAESHNVSTIKILISGKNDDDLRSLLEGGPEISVEPANPALAYLRGLQGNASGSNASSDRSGKAHGSTGPEVDVPPTRTWYHLEIVPGFEVHIENTFKVPGTQRELDNLLQLLSQKLSLAAQHAGLVR